MHCCIFTVQSVLLYIYCKECIAVNLLPIWNFLTCSWFNFNLVARKAVIFYCPVFTYFIFGEGISLCLDFILVYVYGILGVFVFWWSHRSYYSVVTFFYSLPLVRQIHKEADGRLIQQWWSWCCWYSIIYSDISYSVSNIWHNGLEFLSFKWSGKTTTSCHFYRAEIAKFQILLSVRF